MFRGHAGQKLDGSVLRQSLKAVLPDYMVPSAIMVLEALPLNANGKIDRKACPRRSFDAGDAYEAPEGELETQLAQLWADVLGVGRVGRSSNFFELGGHSLLALTLVERMRAAGIRAQVRELFEQPVLSALPIRWHRCRPLPWLVPKQARALVRTGPLAKSPSRPTAFPTAARTSHRRCCRWCS